MSILFGLFKLAATATAIGAVANAKPGRATQQGNEGCRGGTHGGGGDACGNLAPARDGINGTPFNSIELAALAKAERMNPPVLRFAQPNPFAPGETMICKAIVAIDGANKCQDIKIVTSPDGALTKLYKTHMPPYISGVFTE